MKHSFKPYALLIATLIGSTTAFAATQSQPAPASAAQLQQIEAEMTQLQTQVTTLKQQLKQQKAAKKAEKNSVSTAATVTKKPAALPKASTTPAGNSPDRFGSSRYLKGITVTTSPWFGTQSAYDASDLLYELSSMNEDLSLLQQREYLESQLNLVGDTLDDRALIELSGGLEGQYVYANGFSNSNTGTIALDTAEIDVVPMVSSWASGFFSLDYDTSPVSTGNRNPRGEIYLKRGFLTIGNLSRSPVYFSIGQMYAPYGRYSSALLTAPLTLSMMRILTPVMRLGFYKNGFFGSIYGYEGDTNTGNDFLHQGGVNFGYKNPTSFGHIETGLGYVTNIADSQGMQNNGLPVNPAANGVSTQFGGFGQTVQAVGQVGNNIQHSVGGGDAHLELGVGNWYFVEEYMTATEHFASQDMTFNGHAAMPSALHSEIDYTWHWLTKPWTLGAAYGQAWDALALNLPQHSYWAILSVSIWKDTVEAIEYRHDSNFAREPQNNATGNGIPVGDANIGGTQNLVTLQVGVYF